MEASLFKWIRLKLDVQTILDCVRDIDSLWQEGVSLNLWISCQIHCGSLDTVCRNTSESGIYGPVSGDAPETNMTRIR